MEFDFELICAQKHPEYINECIDLLNSEWQRSKTARLVSIQQGSSEGFPTTLLLIDKRNNDNNNGPKVVAHCKVSPVSVYHPGACFIESVVVSPDLRGKGIGRLIMDKMENYVKCRGIHTIFLTTHDQQGFYEKLGYCLCDPVVIYGGKCSQLYLNKPLSTSQVGNRLEDVQIIHENEMTGENLHKVFEKVSLCSENNAILHKANDDNKEIEKTSPPPPPPPLPLKSGVSNNNNNTKLTKNDIILMPLLKVTMKKEL